MAKRARTERRQASRDAVKLARARVRLASLEEGGGSDRPIEVASASIVEPHAASLPCPACGAGGVRVEEHTATTEGDPASGVSRRLRIAHVRCPRCGHARKLYFRIGTALPS